MQVGAWIGHGVASLVFFLAGASRVWAEPAHAASFLPDPTAVAAIDITLTPTGLLTRSPMTESMLAKVGCVFSSRFDRDKAARIVAVLRQGATLSPDSDRPFQLRNAVALTLTSGRTITLLMGDESNPAMPVHGLVDGGESIKRLPLVLEPAAVQALRELAFDLAARPTMSAICRELKKNPPTGRKADERSIR